MPTEKPPQFFRAILFALFFISGFCGLLYQVIWTRMAFAAFGIITPVLSVVLSVFMLGLSVGSVLGGKWIPVLTRRTQLSAAIFYALAEFLIGIGAYAVPKLFALGNYLLLNAGEMNSFPYLFLSACVLALSILPWCLCMGATFPFMMAYIREFEEHDPQSFSFLYTANVLGAMCGTFLTAIVFVEMFGFHQTLQVAAAGNFCIALASGFLGWRQKSSAQAIAPEPARPETGEPSTAAQRINQAPALFIRWILFSTGFCAMAMEVVWTRAFTPVLKTQVYSFALIVFTYLGATFAGSWLYRHHLRKKSPWPVAKVIALLVVAVYLPVVINDPRLVNMNIHHFTADAFSAILILAAICPFCAGLGYLTPRLVDDDAGDDPARAGSAYALNVAGCILGPLFASYLLLPRMGETAALLVLSLPFLVFYFLSWKGLGLPLRALSSTGACVVLGWALLGSRNFEDEVASLSTHVEVRRDYAASVISLDDTNNAKVLLVNGIGMTKKTPATKFMVDLPLTLHQGPSQSALIICFGMGTSYRSALTWDIDTTAVELVPGVTEAFGFYYRDAADVLANPHGRIVIDDGRRFLARTREQYDVVVIDPPPPVEAAGSSLLYSKQMCELVKQHLKPHGIMQLWFPGGEPLISQAIVRSVSDTFPYVRCFGSIEGWGLHILASNDPIVMPAPAELVARMPIRAQQDLMEWFPVKNLTDKFAYVLSQETPVPNLLNPNTDVLITDDDPMNEYFLLRRSGWF